ncbi:hypothetical protein ASZ90_013104 [hydrocarbon metagenome]|jgi:hypothetical protein|uniref:Uncharacterized protein n=1 Tax=hydrocarbon metagenome TaxID=938273 RepID=A0A0W8F8L3_9ZZZZ
MTDHLKEIIAEIKEEKPDNLFIKFLESISDINYGIEEKQDYLKDRYIEISNLYQLQEKI